MRDHTKDEIKTFPSGAQCSNVKERYDLICPAGLRRLAQRYALGAKKYSDYNWCQGIPIAERLNHLISHLISYLDSGNEDDDNMAAIAWNAFAIMHYEHMCKHHEAPHIERPVVPDKKKCCKNCERELSGMEPHSYLDGVGPYCLQCYVKVRDAARIGWDPAKPGEDRTVATDLKPPICCFCHRVLRFSDIVFTMYNGMICCEECKKKTLDPQYLSSEKQNAVINTTPPTTVSGTSPTDERGSKQS